jgi:uncharacterized protein (UPF0147 family)
MTQDPAVPKELRESLAKTIAEVEKKTGDVDSALFWPRLVSSILFENVKNAANGGMEKLMDVVTDLKEKLNPSFKI